MWYGILVAFDQEIKPHSLNSGCRLNHWTNTEVPLIHFLVYLSSQQEKFHFGGHERKRHFQVHLWSVSKLSEHSLILILVVQLLPSGKINTNVGQGL